MKMLALVLLLLSACSATGPVYNHKDIPQSSIVVYRGTSPLGYAGYWEVDVNGVTECKIYNNGYFVRKYDGKTEISSSIWNQPGTSRLTINPKKPEIYYVRMSMDGQKQLVGAAGYIPLFVAEAVSDNAGPFRFELVHPDVARAELVGVKRDCE